MNPTSIGYLAKQVALKATPLIRQLLNGENCVTVFLSSLQFVSRDVHFLGIAQPCSPI